MSDTLNLANSIWLNGIKVVGGHAKFYPLGTNKIDIPQNSPAWPKGNKLISPFVYQDDKLVGFCDTKAMVASSPLVIMPYEHIEADFNSIKKGKVQIHAPKATIKKVSWKDSGLEDIADVNYKFKGCSTVEEVKNREYINLANISSWTEILSDLEDGTKMFFQCDNLTAFNSDLSSLTNGSEMFYNCDNLTAFNSDLGALTNGSFMFYCCSALTAFTSELSSLENGYDMFRGCSNLQSFNSDLNALTNGTGMFYNCDNLTAFNSDLSSLTNGSEMFYNCDNLTTFKSDLSSLTDGYSMFVGCKLDTASVKNIAETIKTVTDSPSIHIGIGSTTPTEEEDTYFTQIHNKGWKVYVNGSSDAYVPATASLDETGEEIITPIPFWAKSEPATEETAKYIDENGNFFNILGGQFIYVDDPETYGMFTCEEDAAANMRLTTYVKPEPETETETINQN